MALPCCGPGCVDDNVESSSSSGDPVGLPDTLARSSAQVKYATMLLKEPVFLGAEPTTSTLIRARSVVQVHPGPPFISMSYRVLSQKPQPTIQPTSHCTICVPTPSAVRYSPCAARVSSPSSCAYRSSVV